MSSYNLIAASSFKFILQVGCGAWVIHQPRRVGPTVFWDQISGLNLG